jgi:phosphate transport system substrate-binding protein
MLSTTNKLVCPNCYYDANDGDRDRCEICSSPLDRTNNILVYDRAKPKQNRFLSSIKIGLAAISLIAIGGFVVYQTRPDNATAERSYSETNIRVFSSMSDVPGIPEGFFNYAGATCFAAMNPQLDGAIKKAHTGFVLRYEEPRHGKPGCSTGIKMLLDGEIAFAQNGRPIKQEEYELAKSRNFSLKQIPVAIDGIVFYIHPDIPIQGLSLDRIKDIFAGKITNWKQLGGPDLPIVAISQDPRNHVTLELIMGVEKPKLGSKVKIVRDYTTAIRQVGTKPGAISYASAAITKDQKSIKHIGLAKTDEDRFVFPMSEPGKVNLQDFRSGDYPITRRLFVVVRQDGTPDEQAGVAYANLLMTKQGQEIAKEAGFVPLYEK